MDGGFESVIEQPANEMWALMNRARSTLPSCTRPIAAWVVADVTECLSAD